MSQSQKESIPKIVDPKMTQLQKETIPKRVHPKMSRSQNDSIAKRVDPKMSQLKKKVNPKNSWTQNESVPSFKALKKAPESITHTQNVLKLYIFFEMVDYILVPWQIFW